MPSEKIDPNNIEKIISEKKDPKNDLVDMFITVHYLLINIYTFFKNKEKKSFAMKW
jgi:hypothetical protein